MKRRRSREFDVFSMSFLDTICCAFGAIILLFVLEQVRRAQGDRAGARGPGRRVAKMQEELAEIRGRTEIL